MSAFGGDGKVLRLRGVLFRFSSAGDCFAALRAWGFAARRSLGRLSVIRAEDVHITAVNKQPIAFTLTMLPDNIKTFQICYGIIDSFWA